MIEVSPSASPKLSGASGSPFDGVSEGFESKRGLPGGISRRLASAAAELIASGRQVLDVGTGTGRIARPLSDYGLRVTGIDLSRQMLENFRSSLSRSQPPVTLIQADAGWLPFISRSFDAVVSVHVLHLMKEWKAALREQVRVLRPDGVLLHGFEWRPPDSPGARLLSRWKVIVHEQALHGHRLADQDIDEIEAALRDMGAIMSERIIGSWTTRRSLRDHLESIEHRTWSDQWEAPQGYFDRCLADLREWAIAEFGDLDRVSEAERKFVWQAWSWNRDRR